MDESFKIRNYDFLPDGKLVSQKIKSIRKEKKIAVEDLSEKLGVSLPTIRSWESGKSLPSIVSIKKLSELLEIEINDILLPNSSFYKPMHYYEESLDIDSYNYFWYLLEKKTFSYLSDIEESHLAAYHINLLSRADNDGFQYNKYIKDALADDYDKKYRITLKDKQKDSLFYRIRKNILVYSDRNKTKYYLEGVLKEKTSVNKLDDFSKALLLTTLLHYEGEDYNPFLSKMNGSKYFDVKVAHDDDLGRILIAILKKLPKNCEDLKLLEVDYE